MVHINIWFVPRSRSTALVRSLSQLPDSKVFFENFLWAFYLGDEDSVFTKNPAPLGEKAAEHVVAGFNTKSVVKNLSQNEAKVKIIKDFIYALKGDYEMAISKDSVNVFLVRDPEYVFTSFLPNSKLYFHNITKRSHSDVSFYYSEVLKGVDYVEKNCDIPPLIIDGQ